MRDAINVTKAGHAAVLFVHDYFERVARAQAKSMGLPDLKIFVYPQYQPGHLSSQAEQEKAAKAAAEFPRLLLARD